MEQGIFEAIFSDFLNTQMKIQTLKNIVNPNIVQIYHKFHDKGPFRIISSFSIQLFV